MSENATTPSNFFFLFDQHPQTVKNFNLQLNTTEKAANSDI